MKYCCYLMKADLERVCVIHQDRWTCGDNVMYLNPETRQYGLKIRDGGRSTYVIHFCPWCGTNLHHHEDKYAAENNTFLTMVKTAQEDAIKKMRVDLKALEAAYLTKPAIPTQERELEEIGAFGADEVIATLKAEDRLRELSGLPPLDRTRGGLPVLPAARISSYEGCSCDLIRTLGDGSIEKVHSPECPVVLNIDPTGPPLQLKFKKE